VAPTAAGFIEDLASKLTCRAYDQDERLSTNPVSERVVADWIRTRGGQLASLAHELGQDRNKERSSLAGA
jgi:hypothetical protein